MKRVVLSVSIAILFSLIGYAQNPNQKPAWDVTLNADRTAATTITVQNRCSQTHNFELRRENVDFLQISKLEVSVKGGGNELVPVVFNTFGLAPKIYRGQVLVICKTCKREPTCTQDKESLPVILRVPGASTQNASNDQGGDGQSSAATDSTKKKDPCKEKCEDLLAELRAKQAKAQALQGVADKASQAATDADTKAKGLEDAAKNAEEAAKDDPSDYKARVNEQEYSSADVAYRLKLQAEINAAHASGQISNEEHERRTKANTTKKAREERLKNKKKLKKEAKAARAKADAARAAANKAKAEADKAQKAADDAKAEAEAARRAYEDCLKKAEEECNKLKAAAAKAKADKEKADQIAAAAEQRRKNAEANREARKKEKERLLALIKELGLIDKKISEVPSIWQWLPDFLETPVATLAEQQTGVPIPTDTIKAIGGLYGIAAAMLNPCTKAGKDSITKRLQRMKNPKTGRNYTFGEAVTETAAMCDLLRELKGRITAVSGK